MRAASYQVARNGLQADHHEQHVVAGETPDDHNNGSPQRTLAGGEHGAALIHRSEEAQDLGDGAHLRGVQRVEQQRSGGETGCGRQQEARAQRIVPLGAFLHDQRQTKAKHQQENRDDHGVFKCEQHRLSEQFIFENLDEILREIPTTVTAHQRPAGTGHDDEQHDWHEEQHDDHQPIRQRIQQATTGCLRLGLGTMRLHWRSVLGNSSHIPSLEHFWRLSLESFGFFDHKWPSDWICV